MQQFLRLKFFLLPLLVFFFPSLLFAGITAHKIDRIKATKGGLFAMESYNGTLYIGMFGYIKRHGATTDTLLYKLDSVTGKLVKAAPGLGNHQGNQLDSAESICALQEFDGYLYAATEDTGEIWRWKTGETSWHRKQKLSYIKYPKTPNETIVRYKSACDLTVHNGRIFAVGSTPALGTGAIFYSDDGVTWTNSTKNMDNYGGTTVGYVREIVSFKQNLYAFSVTKGGVGKWLKSEDDGETWTVKDTVDVIGENVRVFRTYVDEKGLWLATASAHTDTGKTKIWLYTGQGVRFNNTDREYFEEERIYNNVYANITEIAAGITTDGKKIMVAGASGDFKCLRANAPSGDHPETKPCAKRKNSSLLISTDNGENWRSLIDFDDPPNGPAEWAEGLWTVKVHDNKIYFGTMQDGRSTGYGSLYVLKDGNEYVTGIEPPPQFDPGIMIPILHYQNQ